MSMKSIVAATGLASLCAASAMSADLPPDVLTRSNRVTVTRADFDAEIANIPAGLRTEFQASGERLTKLVGGMLETRTLAAEARANGLDKDPAIQARIDAQVLRVLALARIEQIERDAAVAFDRRRDSHESVARENYLLAKDKYQLPEQIRAAHILVRTEKRTKEEAQKLATEIRVQAMAPGASFSALAKQYSEDVNAKLNGGELGWIVAKEMDGAFWAGAAGLKVEGEISQPVLSPYGYHIIRLEARKAPVQQPFEAVKDAIIAEARKDYVETVRKAALEGIYKDPSLQINQPALDSLVTRMDPESFRKTGASAPK